MVDFITRAVIFLPSYVYFVAQGASRDYLYYQAQFTSVLSPFLDQQIIAVLYYTLSYLLSIYAYWYVRTEFLGTSKLIDGLCIILFALPSNVCFFYYSVLYQNIAIFCVSLFFKEGKKLLRLPSLIGFFFHPAFFSLFSAIKILFYGWSRYVKYVGILAALGLYDFIISIDYVRSRIEHYGEYVVYNADFKIFFLVTFLFLLVTLKLFYHLRSVWFGKLVVSVLLLMICFFSLPAIGDRLFVTFYNFYIAFILFLILNTLLQNETHRHVLYRAKH